MLDPATLWKALNTVLAKAQAGHRYRFDSEQYQKPDFWTVSLVGDCEDFALWCRQELARVGIDSDLVHCLTETKEGHLVCAVGGWVLDNRHRTVQTAAEMPYTWLRIGKSDGQWFTIAGFETDTQEVNRNVG